jgi:hypothetical protein
VNFDEVVGEIIESCFSSMICLLERFKLRDFQSSTLPKTVRLVPIKMCVLGPLVPAPEGIAALSSAPVSLVPVRRLTFPDLQQSSSAAVLSVTIECDREINLSVWWCLKKSVLPPKGGILGLFLTRWVFWLLLPEKNLIVAQEF